MNEALPGDGLALALGGSQVRLPAGQVDSGAHLGLLVHNQSTEGYLGQAARGRTWSKVRLPHIEPSREAIIVGRFGLGSPTQPADTDAWLVAQASKPATA